MCTGLRGKDNKFCAQVQHFVPLFCFWRLIAACFEGGALQSGIAKPLRGGCCRACPRQLLAVAGRAPERASQTFLLAERASERASQTFLVTERTPERASQTFWVVGRLRERASQTFGVADRPRSGTKKVCRAAAAIRRISATDCKMSAATPKGINRAAKKTRRRAFWRIMDVYLSKNGGFCRKKGDKILSVARNYLFLRVLKPKFNSLHQPTQ